MCITVVYRSPAWASPQGGRGDTVPRWSEGGGDYPLLKSNVNQSFRAAFSQLGKYMTFSGKKKLSFTEQVFSLHLTKLSIPVAENSEQV